MQKVTAGYAIIAVLVGFVYAPLFHVHGGDGHDMSPPVLHAHFPEPEEVPPFLAFSSHHSHWGARSINVISATSDPVVQIGATMAGDPFELVAGTTSIGFIRHDGTALTHAPPDLELRSPRAPPL